MGKIKKIIAGAVGQILRTGAVKGNGIRGWLECSAAAGPVTAYGYIKGRIVQDAGAVGKIIIYRKCTA